MWRGSGWGLVLRSSVKVWIDTNGWNGNAIDAQYTTQDSVCIDPDASLSLGSLECLDEPDWVFLIVILFFYVSNLKL